MSALRFRLQSWLTLSHLVVGLVGVTLLAVISAVIILRAERSFAASRLEDLTLTAAKSLEAPLRDYLAGEVDLESLRGALQSLTERTPNLDYALFLNNGSLVLNSRTAVQPNAPEVDEVLDAGGGPINAVRPDEQGVERFYSANPIAGEVGALGVLRLSVPTSAAQEAARPALTLLATAALGAIAATGLVGGLLSRSLARPVGHLAVAAERMAHGDFQAQAPQANSLELQRLSEAVNRLAERLQASLDELRVFVANASHELRTPLTTVKLRAEALRAGALGDPEIAPRFLAEIEDEVDRLGRMINDLLDLSRLETRLETSRFAAIDLGELAAEVYETFEVRAEKNGLTLKHAIEPGLPPVLADEDQLWRVLMNLLDNALNYSPPGGVVKLRVVNLPDEGKLRIEVQDSGPGIPPEELGNIFEPFYRTENTRRRNSGSQGSGLGLAISKVIVKSHQGQIGVDSLLREGSNFWIELPAQVGE